MKAVYMKFDSLYTRPFYSFYSLMLSTKKSGARNSSFYVIKKWVMIMIETIIKILFLLGMSIFCGGVIALNYIDEIIDWLNKRNDRKR